MSIGTNPNDPLIRGQHGADDTLNALYDQHRNRLIGLAAAITLDRAVAADVVQEAFAIVAARLETIDQPTAYLQRVVVNEAISVVRQRMRARDVPVRPIANATNPEIDEAWALVAQLPAQQRAVVVLRFWEDLSQEQIAGVLDIPLGTVKSTLHRALRTLKARWPLDLEDNQ